MKQGLLIGLLAITLTALVYTLRSAEINSANALSIAFDTVQTETSFSDESEFLEHEDSMDKIHFTFFEDGIDPIEDNARQFFLDGSEENVSADGPAAESGGLFPYTFTVTYSTLGKLAAGYLKCIEVAALGKYSISYKAKETGLSSDVNYTLNGVVLTFTGFSEYAYSDPVVSDGGATPDDCDGVSLDLDYTVPASPDVDKEDIEFEITISDGAI